jgi:uncharacterized protein (DUF488 family)
MERAFFPAENHGQPNCYKLHTQPGKEHHQLINMHMYTIGEGVVLQQRGSLFIDYKTRCFIIILETSSRSLLMIREFYHSPLTRAWFV